MQISEFKVSLQSKFQESQAQEFELELKPLIRLQLSVARRLCFYVNISKA